MLGRAEAGISGRETGVSRLEGRFWGAERVLSVTDKTLSVTGKVLSALDKVFSATDKTLSVMEKVLSVTERVASSAAPGTAAMAFTPPAPALGAAAPPEDVPPPVPPPVP